MRISYYTVKSVIDLWDPVGLLDVHAPADEYTFEAMEVFRIVKDKPDIDSIGLAKIIYDIFVRCFGNDIFTKSFDECNIISKQLLSLGLDEFI